MRIRTSVAAAAVLAVTLTGCGAGGSGDDKAEPAASSAPTATKSAAPPTPTKSAGGGAEKSGDLPAAPTGTKRAALLAELKAVDPALVADEDKAVESAREQCADIKSDSDPVGSAKTRFAVPGRTMTDKESREVNVAVATFVCLQ
ncbi:hypothetical protein ACFYXJ_27735 [Streptomyces sp. NPDC002667]|uniref:hypothetical protein n=1 Tax=Streptomyces sp. NPDC002667 TaxID=3364657 RepID=UPI0036771CF5